MEFHPEIAEQLKQYWTFFEIQTIEESYKVERSAAALADKGDVAGARALLTEFVARKWAEGVSAGRQWLKKIKEPPMA
jgi:hypothetical protein